MTCDRCGKFFVSGNRLDGTPNGVGLVLQNGRKITVCADCLMAIGRGDKEARKWLDSAEERKHNG